MSKNPNQESEKAPLNQIAYLYKKNICLLSAHLVA